MFFLCNVPVMLCPLFTSFLTFFKPKKVSSCHQKIKAHHMDPTTITATSRRKRKVVVIMGPTGAGKSRLSIDLATRYFHNAEIINSDKMQVYNTLNITTNKITFQQQNNIPHHLFGSIDPTRPVFTPSDFRHVASDVISDVKSRRKLPFIVGGSNSFIYSLLTKKHDPGNDPFDMNRPDQNPISSDLRYECCFIWVDVSLPVLNKYLNKRVDEMLDNGMFDELSGFFRSGEYKKVNRGGLGQAIGVPEFEGYFRHLEKDKDDIFCLSEEMYEEAVRKVKHNTCQLAKKQVSKILRLRDGGWDLKRIDATEAFRVMVADGGGTMVEEIWKKQVVEPSMQIVKRFLDE